MTEFSCNGNNNGNSSCKIPPIKSLKPTGSRFLVEMFTPQENMGTNILVGDNVKVKIFQGYVLDVGPQVPDGFGVEVGDRVWIDGAIVYGPNYKKDNERSIGTVEHHMVKGVIEEEKEG